MNQPLLTLKLPEDLYERLRRAAKGMRQPVETALVTIVNAATPSLEKVPYEYRGELEAMEDLSDDELWKAAETTLTPAQRRRLTNLLRKNQTREMTCSDLGKLTKLRTEADRLMLKRSYAYLLLKYRGHRIPNLTDSSDPSGSSE